MINHIDFYLSDFVPEKQLKIMDIYGDDFDYDNQPILTCHFEMNDEGDTDEIEEDRSEITWEDIYMSFSRRGWRGWYHNGASNTQVRGDLRII